MISVQQSKKVCHLYRAYLHVILVSRKVQELILYSGLYGLLFLQTPLNGLKGTVRRALPIPTTVEWQKETAMLSKLVYLSFGNDFGRTYFGKITP